MLVISPLDGQFRQSDRDISFSSHLPYLKMRNTVPHGILLQYLRRLIMFSYNLLSRVRVTWIRGSQGMRLGSWNEVGGTRF